MTGLRLAAGALAALTLLLPSPAFADPANAVKVTILSTMLAGDPNRGIGEWGFAALLEVDGRKLLMDTGQRAETVLRNASELGIDLSDVSDVVITHNHGDHTAGLVTLRRELGQKNPRALSRVHVARGIFDRRPGPNGSEGNGLLPFKATYEASGGQFIEHAEPIQLMPGVWLTGPVPRQYPERNWSGTGRVQTAAGLVEDTVPKIVTLGTVVKVMQNLLREAVPIRDVRTILEVLAERGAKSQDPVMLTAAVREALGRVIVQQINGLAEELPVITLDYSLEQILHRSIESGAENGVAIEPNLANRFAQSLREAHERQELTNQASVLLVPGNLREFLSRFVKHAVKGMHVIGFNEVPDDKQIRIVASVGDGAGRR